MFTTDDYAFILDVMDGIIMDTTERAVYTPYIEDFIEKIRKIEVPVMTETVQKLTPAEARHSADLSQNHLARLTELSINAVQNAESKRRVWYSTATNILAAINPRRVAKGLPELTIHDVDWTIR